jgi:RNA polymerase sigma-70 factor (ECF subfamily)
VDGFSRSIGTEETFEQADSFLERLRAGDESAFSEVFHLYRDMVYTLAVKLLADKAESLDVTQEVFLTLFRKIKSFRGDCSLKTWLYRVAVNQAANRNRWWKRRQNHRVISLDLPHSSADQPPPSPRSPAPSAARNYLSGEMRRALTQELKQLPFDQRVAVVLRDVEGLTYEEIAEVTGATLGTVKSRIGRGRDRLREALVDFQGGEFL